MKPFRDVGGVAEAKVLGRRSKPGRVCAAVLLAVTMIMMIGAFARPSEAGYASIVVDADTGEVLRSRNADTRNYPASLTKLMTLYMLFEAVDSGKLTLDQRLHVSKRAAGQPPSKLGLKNGDSITVRDAIFTLITKSANDVATVVAEAISGTEWEFAQAMTKRARKLGMKRTRFRNASGLPNRRQLSTARDMATLALAMLRDFPHHYHFFGTERYRFGRKTYRNHNHLLAKYDGLDGMKTGYTRKSGFNLIASAKRDGRRIVAVVFGGRTARSRDRHMVKLLDTGFSRLAKIEPKQPAPVRVATVPKPVLKPRPSELLRETSAAAVNGARVHLPEPSPQYVPDVRIPEGPWAIQVGAYSSLSAAEGAIQKASTRLPNLLDSAAAALSPIEVERGAVLYRARFIGLEKRDAHLACRSLRAETMPCAILPNPDFEGRRAAT